VGPLVLVTQVVVVMGCKFCFEFCTGDFQVAQEFWFSVAAAELALQWVLFDGCGAASTVVRLPAE
jgi:hypothetical protein